MSLCSSKLSERKAMNQLLVVLITDTAVYCLTAAMFFLECTIGPSWAVPMDVGGKYSGTVSGMMNMAGNIGGALSPVVFGVLAQPGSWAATFIVATGLPVVGFRGLAFSVWPAGSGFER